MKYLQQASQLIANRWSVLTVRDVFIISNRFGHAESEVVHNHELKTIAKLFRRCAPEFRADQIYIRFYGGPIGKGRWFSGTLWSFVHDIVAAKIQMEGVKGAISLLNKLEC
jgi:hypothetical protein